MSSREQTIIEELRRIDGYAPHLGIAKHQKMATSPFVFFRGAAQLFYADIKADIIHPPSMLDTLPLTCLMGDCHTSNFGFLTEEGSYGDNVIFAPNDFDDACLGRSWWDLLRFSVSLVLCAEHCQRLVNGPIFGVDEYVGKESVSAVQVQEAIRQFLESYLTICDSRLGFDPWSFDAIADEYLPKGLNKRYQKALQRAAGGEQFEFKSSLAKATDINSVPLTFSQNAHKYQPVEMDIYAELQDVFAPYMDDHILDITQRMNAGTGSVNMQRYYFLVGPADYAGREDLPLCHLVEVKRQREAAALHFFPNLCPTNNLNPAHLTVVCQRRMQRRPDLILDEVLWRDAHWLVRSRHHAKMGIDPEHIGIGKRNVHSGGFVDYAASCGRALALAHCRSDRRSLRFEQATSEWLPAAIADIEETAMAYAEQVKRDQQWLSDLLSSQ